VFVIDESVITEINWASSGSSLGGARTVNTVTRALFCAHVNSFSKLLNFCPGTVHLFETVIVSESMGSEFHSFAARPNTLSPVVLCTKKIINF
jgi:hypothetical protein